MLELRFLEREPVRKQRVAIVFLWSSIVAGLLSVVTAYVLPESNPAEYSLYKPAKTGVISREVRSAGTAITLSTFD